MLSKVQEGQSLVEDTCMHWMIDPPVGPGLQLGGLPPWTSLRTNSLRRESIINTFVKPVQIRGIQSVQGSKDVMGPMGPIFVVATHRSQRAAHLSSVTT